MEGENQTSVERNVKFHDNMWDEDSFWGGVKYYPNTDGIDRMHSVDDFVNFLSVSAKNKKIDIQFGMRYQTDIVATCFNYMDVNFSFPFVADTNVPTFSGDIALRGVRNLRCKYYEVLEHLENEIETKIRATFPESSKTDRIVVSVYGADVIVIRGMAIQPHREKS